MSPTESKTADAASPADHPALVVVWSRDEPQRVGEVFLPLKEGRADHPGFMVGRGDGSDSETKLQRLGVTRQRPGVNIPTAPLGSRKISRDQFSVRVQDDGLELDNVGRRAMLINGLPVEGPTVVRSGQLVELQGALLLLATRRPAKLPGGELAPALWPAFGQADAAGIVGESPATWALRAEIARLGASDAHALLLGPKGAGVELVARGIHQASGGAGALVRAPLGKLSGELVDAAIFGRPAAGDQPRRPGLLESAAGGSLCIERADKLDEAQQARLVSELGSGAGALRLLVATSKEPGRPLSAVLRERVEVPGLPARLEDVALIITALVREAAEGDDEAQVSLFYDDEARRGHPRLDPRLVAAMINRDYLTHLRELEDLLWSAMMSCLGAGLRHVSLDIPQATIDDSAGFGVIALTRERVIEAIARADGSEDEIVEILGLRSRYQLRRLLEKFGLSGGRRGS